MTGLSSDFSRFDCICDAIAGFNQPHAPAFLFSSTIRRRAGSSSGSPLALVIDARTSELGEAASLAYLTLRARAAKVGCGGAAETELMRSPLVNEAKKLIGL